MTNEIPRGPVTETIPYTGGPLSAYELRRRERAAGYAHLDRIAVEGGAWVEPRPIRRRLALQAAGLIAVGVCVIGITAAVWGILG